MRIDEKEEMQRDAQVNVNASNKKMEIEANANANETKSQKTVSTPRKYTAAQIINSLNLKYCSLSS